MSDDEDSSLPLGWMIAILMLFLAVVGWGFAAGLYSAAHAEGPEAYRVARIRSSSIAAFVMNGVSQLGNAPAVIGYTLKHHFWLWAIFGLVEGGVLYAYGQMRRIDKRMQQPKWRQRRSNRR